jgi:hypothetical protein
MYFLYALLHLLVVNARQYSIVKDRVQQSERLEHARALRIAEHWWAWVESNYRPHPYQGCALAN